MQAICGYSKQALTLASSCVCVFICASKNSGEPLELEKGETRRRSTERVDETVDSEMSQNESALEGWFLSHEAMGIPEAFLHTSLKKNSKGQRSQRAESTTKDLNQETRRDSHSLSVSFSHSLSPKE